MPILERRSKVMYLSDIEGVIESVGSDLALPQGVYFGPVPDTFFSVDHMEAFQNLHGISMPWVDPFNQQGDIIYTDLSYVADRGAKIKIHGSRFYLYSDIEKKQWVLFSVGYDGKLDLAPENFDDGTFGQYFLKDDDLHLLLEGDANGDIVVYSRMPALSLP